MKKRFLIISSVILVLSSVLLWFAPDTRAESEYDRVKKLVEELEKKQKQKQQALNNLESQIKKIEKSIKELENEIKSLDHQIHEQEEKIAVKEGEIENTKAQLEEASLLLDEAIARVNEQDALLKARVRAMYETGEVSYLEVLLNADSIGDFLSRIDMMEKVVNSDIDLLTQYQANKKEVELRKEEVEAYLAQLEQEYDELNQEMETLNKLRKDKTVRVASLEADYENADKLREQEEAELAKIAKEYSDAKKKLNTLKFDGVLRWPVPDSDGITSNYGYRTHPVTGKKESMHNGLDIGAPQGTTIIAAADGEVILAEYYGTYGNTVMIDHGGGIVTLYGHIRKGGIKVKKGQKVSRGDKIAEVGATGRATGPHLHFSVIKDGVYIDPMKYLKKN